MKTDKNIFAILGTDIDGKSNKEIIEIIDAKIESNNMDIDYTHSRNGIDPSYTKAHQLRLNNVSLRNLKKQYETKNK